MKSIPCGPARPGPQANAGAIEAMPSPLPSSNCVQRRFSFVCDGLRLFAVLHWPPADKPPLVIGSHGLFSNGDSPKQIALAEALGLLGIAFLRLDHRGCGQSDGRFEHVTSLDGRVRDLTAAFRFLVHELGYAFRLGLFGSSLGGTTCMAAARELKPSRMVTLAAPIDSRVLHTARRADAAPVPFDAAAFRFDLTNRLAGLHDLLVIHGAADEVVPVDHARRIHAASRAPKDLIINPGGDHRVTDPGHQRVFVDACRDWFRTLLTATRKETTPC
jgi:dipeptidyl aminopeptidase/acylaminoacyl peptidase